MIVRPNLFPKKRSKFSFQPDIICRSIVDVDFLFLKKLGVTTCLIDLDGTVVGRGTFEVDPRIGKALSKSGLKIHIATNRPKSRTLHNLKEDLYADSVIHPKGIFPKPSKKYYLNALKELNLQPNTVVMIGDRYLQDILGANRAGIYSLLVHKLGPSKGKIDRYISAAQAKFTDSITSSYEKVK